MFFKIKKVQVFARHLSNFVAHPLGNTGTAYSWFCKFDVLKEMY